MSEYWKSTPKYWCKFCSTFVRDTGLEKKQHEATPRHQSNIQRSLRNLHKNTERDEREKQRAKDEVARLNGLVGGKSGASGSGTSTSLAAKSSGPLAQATPEERKRQMAQLAAMGITPPKEPTNDTNDTTDQGGQWSTVSETPIYRTGEGHDDSKPAIGAFGVRKRKLDEDEEEAEAVSRKGWGSKLKSYPGNRGTDDDLDALLSNAVIKKKDESDVEVKKEEPDVGVKQETDVIQGGTSVKQEDGPTESPAEPRVVFKKRKGKR